MPVDIRKLANMTLGVNKYSPGNTNMASMAGGTGGVSAGPPMPPPPSSGAGTVSAGAASIPGQSIHCLKCGAKLKKGMAECPKCGNDVRQVAKDAQNDDAAPDNSQSDDTGGEAAVRDAKADGDSGDEGKYASRVLRAALPLAKNMAGGAAVVGGLTIAGKYTLPMQRKMTADAREQEYFEDQQLAAANRGRKGLRTIIRKAASARCGNPIFNIRKGAPSSVEEGLRDAGDRVAALKSALARKGY